MDDQITFRIFSSEIEKKRYTCKIQKKKKNLDLYTAHVDLKLNNVCVNFFPSKLYKQMVQALGIIRTFKVRYRKDIIKKALLALDFCDLKMSGSKILMC